MPPISGCKDIGIIKSEFAAKTQFITLILSEGHTPLFYICIYCSIWDLESELSIAGSKEFSLCHKVKCSNP